ncbi:hypothetical protein D0Z07_7704 [Hyphodiscus hymeniophilus]|uniref:Fringe-like glycosyltransferase domain-containing protein n=1 Tax=Hyphodiscus hymeniophilus TaxID=353542 RepID=A0A9P6VE10_9HELO|nr:hypothetical protein D0Z07_7704 [Hyphodiscus hymeniophilus]
MAASMTSNPKILNPRSPFARVVLLTAFCLVFLIVTLRSTTDHVRRITNQLDHVQNVQELSVAPDCSMNTTHLQSLQHKYGLTDRIEYGRRYVRFHRQDIQRKGLTTVNEDLFPTAFDAIDIQNPPSTTTCLKPLEVAVPRSPYPRTVDASDLLFGISTTYGRLIDPRTSPLKEWAHWLTDGRGNSNGAGLILRLVDASESELEDTRRTMGSMGIDVKVYLSNSATHMAQRYLSLLPALYNDPSRKHRKWLAMCDDDTFFPSMHALLDRLSTFDHHSDLYIGTLSEDINNIQRHGSQAFGGAGVFFSLHTASVITKLHDSCSTDQKLQESNTGWGPQGDILLRKCIYENTEIRLTMLRDLHQLDLQGDPSGFYEAGLAPLSLHHFKGGSWHWAKPYEGAQIIHGCGEACYLQRFVTTDDFIISNGYSVAYYPYGIQFDVNQMERTFSAAPDDFGSNLDFMLSPQRGSLVETGRKVAWELQESTIEADGSVRQTYIRKANDHRWTENPGGKQMFEKDGLMELIWIS